MEATEIRKNPLRKAFCTLLHHTAVPPETFRRRRQRGRPAHKSLFNAALYGNVPDVVWFLDNGADVNEKDSNGDRPIHYACFSKHRNQSKIVEILLREGADTSAWDASGTPAMHHLALSEAPSKFQSMKLLMSHGVSVNVRDEQDRTPLHTVLTTNNLKFRDTVRFLLSQGAEPLRNKRLTDTYCVISYYRLCYLFGSFEKATLSDVPTSELKVATGRIWRRFEAVCIAEVERAKRDMLIGSVSWHRFLVGDEKEISQMAREHIKLYLILKSSSARQLYRHYGVEHQFCLFCYHFALQQLDRIRPGEEFPLNYECLLHLASFLSLEDVVNLCEALNFPPGKV